MIKVILYLLASSFCVLGEQFSEGGLVDWATSRWLSAFDFALRAVLSPDGLYGINKFVNVATNGTGTLHVNVSSLNLTWHFQNTTFVLDTVQLGGLNSVSGLSVLEPLSSVELGSNLTIANTTLAVNVTVNSTKWLQFKAQTQGVSVAVTALVEAYEDELEAMHENQVTFSRCWNQSLASFGVSELHANLSAVSGLSLAGSSWPVQIKMANALLKKLVSNEVFQHTVQFAFDEVAQNLRSELNDRMDALLGNSSAPPCPPPLDRSSVDLHHYSAFQYLPLFVLGLLAAYGGLALGLRDPSKPPLGLAYWRAHSGKSVIVINVLLLGVLAAQLYALQVAIASVSLDARVCQGNPCEPVPVVMMPITHFSFSVLMRYLWNGDAWLLVCAIFMSFCVLPLGILAGILAVWWMPLAGKWVCVRRYVTVVACQTCKLSLASMIFQVYMISVLGSSSKLILDDQSSFLQIKIQGEPEVAIFILMFATLVTWVLCHATLRAHDEIWPRSEVDWWCCFRKREPQPRRVLVMSMLLATTLAAVSFAMGFLWDLATFTTTGLLGTVESGNAPGGFVTHVSLISLGSRVTELTPVAYSKTVLVISAVYYLTMVAVPAATIILLFIVWGCVLKQTHTDTVRLLQPGADTSYDSTFREEKPNRWLTALFVCTSLGTLDGLIAVTAGAAAEMPLLFVEVVNGRLPFVCSLWSSLSHGECVGLEGTFQAGAWWVACSWGLVLVLSVITEYCFVIGFVGFESTKNGYSPICTD